MAPLRTAGLAFKSDTLLRTPIARLLKPSSRCVLTEQDRNQISSIPRAALQVCVHTSLYAPFSVASFVAWVALLEDPRGVFTRVEQVTRASDPELNA
jgi:hypothetical protein